MLTTFNFVSAVNINLTPILLGLQKTLEGPPKEKCHCGLMNIAWDRKTQKKGQQQPDPAHQISPHFFLVQQSREGPKVSEHGDEVIESLLLQRGWEGIWRTLEVRGSPGCVGASRFVGLEKRPRWGTPPSTVAKAKASLWPICIGDWMYTSQWRLLLLKEMPKLKSWQYPGFRRSISSLQTIRSSLIWKPLSARRNST